MDSVGFDIEFFFFFKQKTAYEMRISDWSSDVCSSDLAADQDGLLASLRDSCVGIAGNKVCDAATMDALPNAKVIAHHGVGYDGVAVAAATARGITVSNTPDVLSDEVADFAIALPLATLRRIPQADRYVREGRWEREGDMKFTARMWGRRVGILGLGRLGIEIARPISAEERRLGHKRART